MDRKAGLPQTPGKRSGWWPVTRTCS